MKFSDFSGEASSEIEPGQIHVDQPDDQEDGEVVYDMISTVICKDSVVAIRPSADSFYDFFLFHVTSDGVASVENVSSDDEYGHEYPPGIKVICGYYYEAETSTRKSHKYKAKPQTTAIIPKDCVLYFGFESQCKNTRLEYGMVQDFGGPYCTD